jgi:hypothetical protein
VGRTPSFIAGAAFSAKAAPLKPSIATVATTNIVLLITFLLEIVNASK